MYVVLYLHVCVCICTCICTQIICICILYKPLQYIYNSKRQFWGENDSQGCAEGNQETIVFYH